MKNRSIKLTAACVILLSVFVFIMFTAVSSEASDKKETTGSDPGYYPLAVGSTWSYSSVETGDESVYRVTGMAKVGKFDSYRVESLGKGGQLLAVDYYAVQKDKVLITGFDNLTQSIAIACEPPATALVFPLKPGISWSISRKNSRGQFISETRRVIGEEKVSIPAGEYQTILVKSEGTISGNPVTVERWYAKGIGMVKLQYSAGGRRISYLLTRYTAGK